MVSYEYIQFLNEKIMPYLPTPNVHVGDKINFRCPFCGDSQKSSTKKRGWYYLSNGSYYCFNCGLSLSGIKFLEQMSGQEYADIKREYVRLFLKSSLSSHLSSFVEKPETEPTIFSFKNVIPSNWKNPLSETAKEYLSNRLVFQAPFLKESFFSLHSKNNEEFILIPWRINGIDAFYQVNDFQHHYSMKYIFPKNKKKLIYGIDNVDATFPYIIVFEGVYDSLFVKNGVASGTKTITEYQLNILKDRWPRHQICCAFDNDRAGIASMKKLIQKNTNIKFFRWFNQNTKQKDINDYVIAQNDVNIFANPKLVERMIYDRLQMKMFLVQNGLWKDEAKRNIVVKNQIVSSNEADSFIQKLRNSNR